MNVALIVPAYNAAPTISRLLKEAGMFFDMQDIMVVNDGSKDGTGDRARETGVAVLHHGANLGKGASLRTAFHRALDEGYDWVVTMDADGQHASGEIGAFLEAAKDGVADVVIGTRMNDPGSMPWQRRLSNRMTSRIVTWRTGQNILDSQSGFRAISTKVLSAVTLNTDRFQTESELLIKASLAGFLIGSVPVSSIYAGGGSAISPFLDTVRFIVLILNSLFWRKKRRS